MKTLKKGNKAEEKVVAEITMQVEHEMLAGYLDENDVVHKTFTIREMTGKDQEVLANFKNSAKAASNTLYRVVTSIGSITQKQVGTDKWKKIIDSLYTGDQDYILIKIREDSIGSEITQNFVCPTDGCGTKITTVVETSELEIRPFKGDRIIPFELPKGYIDKEGKVHKKGTMRLPNGLDREVLLPVAKTNLVKAQTILLNRICTFDSEVYIDNDTFSSLTIRDREYLQKLLNENTFGVDTQIDVECDQCNNSFRGTLNSINFL